MGTEPLSVLILAAGRGTRMKSRTAKVLHPLLGVPMLTYVADLARRLPADRRAVVVGYQSEAVAALLPPGVFEIVRQRRQWGTGHAVRQARGLLAAGGDLLVLSGDTPLLTRRTLGSLLAAHRRRGAVATVLTSTVPDPGGYGRIVRSERGVLKAVVEHGDATPEERLIREVNTGVYCFDTGFLEPALRRLRSSNRQDEYYLTDVIGMAVRSGAKVAGTRCRDYQEILGINDRTDLARAEEVLRRRKLQQLMCSGVTVTDPGSVWVEHRVRVGAETVLLPQTMIEGETRIGRRCRLGPATRIRDSRLGDRTVVRGGSQVEGARIASGCQIGLFARLFPGTRLHRGERVPSFAELGADSVRQAASKTRNPDRHREKKSRP